MALLDMSCEKDRWELNVYQIIILFIGTVLSLGWELVALQWLEVVVSVSFGVDKNTCKFTEGKVCEPQKNAIQKHK